MKSFLRVEAYNNEDGNLIFEEGDKNILPPNR